MVTAGDGPARDVGAGEIRVPEVDFDPGARLAAGSDEGQGLIFLAVEQVALCLAGGPLPRRPGIVDPGTPHLAGALDHGTDRNIVAYLRR